MSVAEAFDTFNQIRLSSPTLEKVWKDGYGDAYASEARPNAFYPQAALDQIAAAAVDLHGQTMLDLGCGHGKTGAYLAQRLGMKLLGIDPSSRSIELAKQQEGTFWVGSAEDTGLKEKVYLVICMDVMLYLDKKAAIREVARILNAGGIFAFTVWEQKGFSTRLGIEQIDDYRPLLQADFDILTYDSQPEWTELQNKVLSGIVANEEQLKVEVGEKPAAMLVNMAKGALNESAERRYVLVIAKRK